MKPATLDLPTVWRGCSYTPVLIQFFDQDGNPIDVTGWTARARARSFNLNALVLNYAQGIAKVSLTKEQTENLRLGVEDWDFIWVKDGVAVQPFFRGKIPISQPRTRANRITRRQLAGGSNYVQTGLDPDAGLFAPVIGTFHRHREEIEAQLTQMFENGQRQISLILWFVSELDYLHPEELEWIDGIAVITQASNLYIQHQQNLIDLMAILSRIGFEEMHLRFSPLAYALDVTRASSGNSSRDETQRAINIALLVQVAELVELNKGPLRVIYDCASGFASHDIVTNPIRRNYCQACWVTLVNHVGHFSSCGFSCFNSTGAGDMIDLFKSVNVPLPSCYSLHAYGGPGYVLQAMGDTWQALHQESPIEGQKPFYLGETYYDDATVGSEVRQALAQFRGINFGGIHQFPVLRGGLPILDQFPWRFNQYLEL
jgi:hypothetical protein